MKLSIRDLDLRGKRVFIRVDFNVPIKDGAIADDTRIRATLPTIEFAIAHGATVILASHLGRPKGKASPQLSLRPVADRLSKLLGKPVTFADDCIGEAAKQAVDKVYASGGSIVLLENLRFHPEPTLSSDRRCAGFGKPRWVAGASPTSPSKSTSTKRHPGLRCAGISKDRVIKI